MLARCPHCGARFDTDEGGPLCYCRQENCKHREVEVKWSRENMPDDIRIGEGLEPIVVDVECKECGEEGEVTLDITIREIEWKRGG